MHSKQDNQHLTMYYYLACRQPQNITRVVEAIIKWLNEKFGQESPLSTTQGKVLEYLGMPLDYTTAGKVKISIHEYIDKMLMELPIDMNGTARPPASRHIFNVNQLVAKLLYLSRRI